MTEQTQKWIQSQRAWIKQIEFSEEEIEIRTKQIKYYQEQIESEKQQIHFAHEEIVNEINK